MPRLGLALVAVWFLSLFVLRTAVQWWRTGKTGVHGISGAVGSLEWNAGVVASVGLVLGVVTPIAALRGWPGGDLIFLAPGIHWLGAVGVALGIVGALAAQLTMGDSWRVGVDQQDRTELVTGGIFRWVRNPIFSFIFLSGFGLCFLVPNGYAVAALLLTSIGIEVQVRAVEEPYLESVHGARYEEYRSGVGRFFPGVGCR